MSKAGNNYASDLNQSDNLPRCNETTRTMTTAPKIDAGQIRRFLRMLYRDGDWFHLLAFTEDGVPASAYEEWVQGILSNRRDGRFTLHARPLRQRSQAFDSPRGFARFEATEESFIATLRHWNSKKFGVAASIPVYGLHQPRCEQEAIALSAFVVDIDPPNFEAVCEGTSVARTEDYRCTEITIEEVIMAVLEKLRAKGLVPHALVRSGRGLHVYIAVERIVMTNDADRDRVKEVWWKLCRGLGGAMDRHDLASVLRVPGSIHWKGGRPKPVSFVEEHTDTDRKPYTFEEVSTALSDIEPIPKGKKIAARAQSNFEDDDFNAPIPELTDEDRALLEVALELDRDAKHPHAKNLAKRRAETRGQEAQKRKGNNKGNKGKKKDSRSEADFSYACRMLEVGFPEQVVLVELLAGDHAAEEQEPIRYCRSTFRRALNKVWPMKSAYNSRIWKVFSSSSEAHYKAGGYWLGSASFSSSCGLVQAPPAVKVVLARPGDGKTKK